VAGIIATMSKDGFMGPVNLGNPNEMTIADLAKKVIDMTGSKSKIVQKPLPKDDPTRRQPDISLAKRELGWAPKVDLEAGLKRTIADFDERLRRGETAR
jgi:UDP-glucuronate decarboxylase